MSEINKTFYRGLLVVERLQENQQMTLVELVKQTGYTKQALLRSLDTLIALGWVRKRVNDWRYIWIGIRGSQVVKAYETWANACMPIIQKVELPLGMACDLAVPNMQGTLTLVDSTRKRTSEGINGYVAGYQPSLVMTALGRAYLFACSSEGYQQNYQSVVHHGSLAERNFVGSKRWYEEKSRLKQRGFTVRLETDYLSHLVTESLPSVAIAVALVANDEPLGALNIVWQESLIPMAEVIEKYLPRLRETAAEISAIA